MAPLSVLPGRLRFELHTLVNNGEGCDVLEESLLALEGVSEVSASHRTGRVLIRFDENLVSQADIQERINCAIDTLAILKQQGRGLPQARRGANARNDASVGHFVMEMALHAFLPAPLDLILPTAATVFRK